MLSEKEAKQIIDTVVSLSKADDVDVAINGGTTSNLRFARNTPSTSGTASNTVVSVQSTFGKRTGTSTTNQLDKASLHDVVARAEELARLAPEDPEYMPPLGPQKYPSVKAYFEKTAKVGPEFLANGASECIKQASAKKLVAAGFIRTNAGFNAIGNSKGLFGYHTSTTIGFSETVRTADGGGSGWVSRAANKTEDINFRQLSKIAVDKAVASIEPMNLKPGKYVTILEHSCVADLLGSMAFSMNARNADEGRSFFSQKGGGNKLGETIFPEFVNLYSDPADPIAPGGRWSAGGLPNKKTEWIKNGTVANLFYTRYWAEKQGKEPVGFPSNIIMKGGKGSLDDLIRSTKQGILVTSFWYIRSVDPRTILLTGLTRDGVYWIENGKIAFPVNNFRWNDSPISMLKNIEAMSKEKRVPPRESGSSGFVIPALKLKEFNFSSQSEAV
ncbi:MAG: TldD/PmbA family protein [Ignavibacteriales bacterium]|nr:TldD/PmbA family protein [Ignavibacteriales bacterium]